MIIAIGSKNQIKIEAVTEVIADYPMFLEAKIFSFASPSHVSGQPLSLAETIQGAKNRAKNAFSSCESCSYSFGIEGGIMEAPGTQTGYIEASVCCIFDGRQFYIGLSSGFEIPSKILSLVLHEKMELSDAVYHSGVTSNPKIGSSIGLIGILTNGRLERKHYTKQSIISTLIQLEHSGLYKKEMPLDSLDTRTSL